MMSDNKKARILKRIAFYSKVHSDADVASIANLAHEEMVVSIIYLIYKFENIDYFYSAVAEQKFDSEKLKLSMFLAPYQKEKALKIIKSLINSTDESTSLSAKNIITEKYNSIEETISSYKSLIEKIAKKRKIQLSK